jgi:DNA-directed RNA polymerase subunit RPC12/RpoP
MGVPMPIQFSCQNCGLEFAVHDDRAGKRTKCPQCGQRIIIPGGAADFELILEQIETSFEPHVVKTTFEFGAAILEKFADLIQQANLTAKSEEVAIGAKAARKQIVKAAFSAARDLREKAARRFPDNSSMV